VINGRKQYLSNGTTRALRLYANTDRSQGMLQGTSSFLIPRDTPGFHVTKCNETMGCRFMNNGELTLEDCRIPADHLLVENTALASASKYFRAGKIIQAAKNLGVGVRLFERAAEFAQNHVQGGRILIKHQAVALRLADMACRIEAVRALVDRAAGAVDERHPMRHLLHMGRLCSEEIMRSRPIASNCTAAKAPCWKTVLETVPRRGDLSAWMPGRHQPDEDHQEHVPGHCRQICGAGVLISEGRWRMAQATGMTRGAGQAIAGRVKPLMTGQPPRSIRNGGPVA